MNSLIGAAAAAALLFRGISGHSFLYQALGISTAGEGGDQGSGPSSSTVEVQRSLTVGKPAHELYSLWRDPQSLSQLLNLLYLAARGGAGSLFPGDTPLLARGGAARLRDVQA